VRPELASYGARLGAAVLDGIIAFIIAIVTLFPWAAADDADGSTDGAYGLGWLATLVVLVTAYYALTMRRRGARNGQTLGKQAASIRVVRDDGKPVTISTVLLRDLLLKFGAGTVTVIGWLVDGLWPLGERENRALHDLAASTHVVSTRAPRTSPPRPPVPAPPRQLSPGIQAHLNAAYSAANRIREAIQRAQLPYVEVSREVDSLLGVMQNSALRAQMLCEALDEKPVAAVQARLAQLDGSGKLELIDALQEQLEVQRRLDTQLGAFNDEMERIVVELETIRSSLLNVSASTDVGVQEQLASQVTALRDEMSSVASGMSAAFD
jgi:uncharacterized RDD family membrane protein YckC